MSQLKTYLTIASALILTAANAQNEAPGASAERAVYAYAKGTDSYLSYRSGTYNTAKKYVVVKCWNEAEPLTETEKTELASLTKSLAKKGVKVVDIEWKSAADLQGKLAEHGVKVEVKDDKRINLKGDGFNLNTTSGKALLVLEDGKASSLCSGVNCEDRLKSFFKLRSMN